MRFGIGISGDKINLSYNSIDVFADDGIDFTSGNTTISFNSVTNHYGRIADGNHNDGIQGWALDGITRENLTVDANVVVESTGSYSFIPALPTATDPDYIQGISIFDGAWDNVAFTNNVVAVSAYHGMGLYGFSNAIIANNTVVKLSSSSSINPWLGVFNSKGGTPPSNVIVRNNIANMFNLATTGVTDDHNLSLRSYNVWSHSATDSVASDPSSIFVSYNPASGVYDLRLKSGSAAINAGSPAAAPNHDVLGKTRTQFDEGAYSF